VDLAEVCLELGIDVLDFLDPLELVEQLRGHAAS